MVITATSLERLGLVEIGGIGWRLTERGREKAELFKSWAENPELRPKPGGMLKKGRF